MEGRGPQGLMIHYYLMSASVSSHKKEKYLQENKLLDHSMHGVGGMPFVDDNSQTSRIIIFGEEIS
jgi:hypothetical protein